MSGIPFREIQRLTSNFQKAVAGIENSYVVTSNGPGKLTPFDDRNQVLP